MDGHECKDVVEYQNKVFLPAITQFKSRMAKLALNEETGELIKIMPEVVDDQPWIIIQYHNESCFHANDEARVLWLWEGEQPLWKKVRAG